MILSYNILVLPTEPVVVGFDVVTVVDTGPVVDIDPVVDTGAVAVGITSIDTVAPVPYQKIELKEFN